jgi:hypothetical protein
MTKNTSNNKLKLLVLFITIQQTPTFMIRNKLHRKKEYMQLKRIITKLITVLSYFCIKNSDLIYFDRA